MAAGLPVVVSDHVGLALEVKAHATGLVTEVTPAAVSVAVSQVMENAGKWGKNGIAYAQKHFSLESVAAEIIAFYRGVVPL